MQVIFSELPVMQYSSAREFSVVISCRKTVMFSVNTPSAGKSQIPPEPPIQRQRTSNLFRHFRVDGSSYNWEQVAMWRPRH